MASLVARTDRLDKIRAPRDFRYYAWRFRSPLARYRFFYWQKTTLEGFLILNTTAGPVQLVDWAATTPEVLIYLLQAAAQDVGPGILEIWSATLPAAIVATLGEHGFVQRKRSFRQIDLPDTAYRPAVLARCMNTALPDAEWSLAGRHVGDLENWELRMVCSDEY